MKIFRLNSKNCCRKKFKSEAATKGVLWEKLFLEISQNSQENICAWVSFLIKLQASGSQENTCARISFLIKTETYNFIKKVTLVQVFSREFRKFFGAFLYQNTSGRLLLSIRIVPTKLLYLKSTCWLLWTLWKPHSIEFKNLQNVLITDYI